MTLANNSNEKVSAKNIAILTELGLTVPQAKIYLTLAKSKCMKAQAISVDSGIARSDVYRVLSLLEKDGFVITIIDEPKRFQAIPISECLHRLISKREGKTAALKKEAQALIAGFKQNGKEEKNDCRSDFIFIPEKQTLFSRSRKMITETRESICLLGRRKMLFWMLTNSQAIEAAIARKVNCRLILEASREYPENLKQLEVFSKYPTFSLKELREPMQASFGIYDGKEMVIGTTEEDLPNKFPALWSNNKYLVDLT